MSSFHQKLQQHWQANRRALEDAQPHQKAAADQHCRVVHFVPGDMVLLSTRNLILKGHPTSKLKPSFVGPFRVEEQIGAVAYRLALPASMQVHPTFHGGLLKNYQGKVPFTPPVVIEGEEEYQVKAIL